MKKIAFLFTFLLMLAAGSVSAQKTFRFGFQASPSWTWMGTDDKKLEGVTSNWGLKLGMLGEFYFAPNYAFMTGIGFGFNQGGRIQNGYYQGAFWPDSELATPLRDLPMDAKLHYRINYVEVPFGLKMRGGSGEDNPIKFYAEIPTFVLGFATKGTGDITGDDDLPGNLAEEANDINIKEEVKKISMSWGLGGGIEYELASSATIVAGLAYQQQFTDVTDDDGMVRKDALSDLIQEKSKATIKGLTLRIGIFF